jgi:hypothetical protein
MLEAMANKKTRRASGRGRGEQGGQETAMTVSERLSVVFAVVISLFGFLMLVGVLIGALEGTSKYSRFTDVTLTILLGVVPLVGGIRLYRRVRRTVVQRQTGERESAVLQVVRQHEGVVSPVDVAADCGMSLEQAEETLKGLQLRGFAEMDVTDTGTVIYRFPL